MKFFKKYILLFLIIFLSIWKIGIINAEDECKTSCKLWDGTPDILLNYIADVRKVIVNVTWQTYKTQKDGKIEKDLKVLKDDMVKLYNLEVNWQGYYSYFNFYVVYPVSNEYVYEIWRDYGLLDDEWKWIEKYKKVILKRWLSSQNITKEEICKWIENKNCNFEWWNILKVLTEIQKNNERLKDYFRLSILWEETNYSGWGIYLTWDNFLRDFNQFYNKNTTTSCSSCNSWFMQRIWEAFNNIWELNNAWKKWIENWKKAISMINWTMADQEYARIEKELLQKELSRQWVWWWGAEAILWNLERFNNWWLSWWDNFVVNSFNNIANSVVSQIDNFSKTVFTWSLFFEKWKEKESTSVWSFIEESGNNYITEKVRWDIALIYSREVDSISAQEDVNQQILAKLVNMHFNLNTATKVLDSVIEIAEKVCNDQGSWMWKCSYN